MRFVLTRKLWEPATRSMFGLVVGPDFMSLTVEREWAGNVPFMSCVPTGFYVLEPHAGTKYKNTYALVGESVSHVQEEGIARSACVLHWASTGAKLAGCVSSGHEMRATASGVVLASPSVDAWLEVLSSREGPHYLQIRDQI